MKIILKEEVYNVGLPGDVAEVADGYARNYLIPRGMAIKATKGAMKEAEAITRARKAREAKTVDDAREKAEAMEARALKIEARVDERGTLYGSVTRDDVHRVLKERGFQADKRKIELRGSIKEIGEYEIPVQVHPQVTATVTVEIVDVEGIVKKAGEGVTKDVEVEVDADAVSEAAEAAAAGATSTNVEALAEQALEAARQYEEQQVLSGRNAPEPDDSDIVEEGELAEATEKGEIAESGPEVAVEEEMPDEATEEGREADQEPLDAAAAEEGRAG